MKNTIQQQPKQNLRITAQALTLLMSASVDALVVMQALIQQCSPVVTKLMTQSIKTATCLFSANTCSPLNSKNNYSGFTKSHRGTSGWNQICSILGGNPKIGGVS